MCCLNFVLLYSKLQQSCSLVANTCRGNTRPSVTLSYWKSPFRSSRSSAFDPKFSSQQGSIFHRSLELMGSLTVAMWLMADWQEEVSIMTGDCSTPLTERSVRKILSLNTLKHECIHLEETLLFDKVFKYVPQLMFVNIKTKYFTYFYLFSCAYFLQNMLLEWVKAWPRTKRTI